MESLAIMFFTVIARKHRCLLWSHASVVLQRCKRSWWAEMWSVIQPHHSSHPLACVSSGSLQVRYNLGGLREPFAIDVDQRNLANGQPHSINMSRVDRSITIQVQASNTHTWVLLNTFCYAQNQKALCLYFKLLLTSSHGVHAIAGQLRAFKTLTYAHSVRSAQSQRPGQY